MNLRAGMFVEQMQSYSRIVQELWRGRAVFIDEGRGRRSRS